jgi:DNA-binding response OmpR family regulator
LKSEVVNSRALYVEDDADTSDLVEIWLGIHGCQVTTVGTTTEALRLAQNSRFDIYILDNWLPDGNGIELCKKLRVLNQQTAILFLSGAAYQSDIEQSIAAGAQAYLTKPVDLEELYETVIQLVKGVHVGAAK